VVKGDVFGYLEKTLRKFDIIFADPPYEIAPEDLERIVSLVFERELLNDEGLLIIEHSSKISMEEHPYFEQVRKYGGTSFSFFSFYEEEEA